MDVREAVASRHSIRGFLDGRWMANTIRWLFDEAARAPSGGNLQPWHLHVVAGAPLEQIKATMAELIAQLPRGEEMEYDIYPRELGEPYSARRFKVGEDMYGLIPALRARIARHGAAGFRATSRFSARRWRCSAMSTGTWGCRNGRTWACFSRR